MGVKRPGLPVIPEAEWRPLVPGDAGAMADLNNACFVEDHTYRITPGEMSDEFDRFGFVPERRMIAFRKPVN